eukprot:5158814-Pyramimonas_sp.AAC.1
MITNVLKESGSLRTGVAAASLALPPFSFTSSHQGDPGPSEALRRLGSARAFGRGSGVRSRRAREYL